MGPTSGAIGGCSASGGLVDGPGVEGPAVDETGVEAGEGSWLGSEVDGRVHPLQNPPHKPRRNKQRHISAGNVYSCRRLGGGHPQPPH